MNLSLEYVLMFALFVYALYYFMNKCGCRSVEGIADSCMDTCENKCVSTGAGNKNDTWNNCMAVCYKRCPAPSPPPPEDPPTPAEAAKIRCMNKCSSDKKCSEAVGNTGWNTCMEGCKAQCQIP